MKPEDYEEITRKNFEDRMKLSRQKSLDYTACDLEDKLSNFKRVSLMCELLGVNFSCNSDAAMFHIVHKLDREMQLKKSGKSAYNENREDTLWDLANYVDLYFALAKEEDKESYLMSRRGSLSAEDRQNEEK